MVARENGAADPATLAALPEMVRAATATVLRRQGEVGIAIGSDGEQGKIGYATYVKERLTGFDGEAGALSLADLDDSPEVFDPTHFAAQLRGEDISALPPTGSPPAPSSSAPWSSRSAPLGRPR